MLPLTMTEQGMISPVKKIEEGGGGEDKKTKEKDNVSLRFSNIF